MNVALGGSLYQDIENHWQDKPSDYLYHEMIVEEFRVNVLPTDKDELVNHGDIGLGFRWIGYG